MPPERQHLAIRILHWLIASLVLAALFMSTVVMPLIPEASPEKLTALFRHMSTGGLIALFVSLRLVLRPNVKRPVPLSSGMPWADRLASITHPFLDVLVVVMLASGIGMAILSGLPAIVFGGHGSLPVRLDTLPLHAIHSFTAKVLIATLGLHISGALYHQFFLRDGLLSRMGLGRYKMIERTDDDNCFPEKERYQNNSARL